jgi:hypothetical protein
MAITAGMGLYSLIKAMAPEFTLDTHSYNAHQSLDNFKNSHFYATRFYPQTFLVQGAVGVARPHPMRQSDMLRNSAQETDHKPPPDEEVEQRRLESYQMLIKNHQRSAMQELIRTAIVLLVSCILFFVHWRLIRKYDIAAI